MRSERQSRVETRQRGSMPADTAALIFDPHQSAFVWSNAAGLRLFGVKSLARLGQDRLDRALPSAVRLIAFADDPDAKPEHMALDFWTTHGQIRIEAKVERLALGRDKVGVLIRSDAAVGGEQAATSGTRGSPEAVLPAPVTSTSGRKSAEVTVEDGRPSIDAKCDAGRGLSHEDRETLHEIARLIREGELTSIPEPPTQAPEDEQPPSSDLPSEVLASIADADELPQDGPPALDFESDAMRLLAEVAHEIRTPLTAVRGYAELIAGKPDDARVADRARHIVDATDHALSLVADILDARLIASGQADMVFTDVSLGDEIEQAAAMISPQAATAKVEVAVEVEPGLPRVVADARRVRQVLVNLMTNAVKFTATGGHVCIEARYLPEEGAEVVISDSGRGMSDAEIATLSAGGPPGVARRRRGIGLPLSRALAEANGARLTIDSRPGAGTTVRIRFPLSCVVPP